MQELASVVDDPDDWLTALEESVVEQLRERGGSTALALSRAEPRLRTKLVIAEGKAYGGPASIGSRVLNIMSSAGPDRPWATRWAVVGQSVRVGADREVAA